MPNALVTDALGWVVIDPAVDGVCTFGDDVQYVLMMPDCVGVAAPIGLTVHQVLFGSMDREFSGVFPLALDVRNFPSADRTFTFCVDVVGRKYRVMAASRMPFTGWNVLSVTVP